MINQTSLRGGILSAAILFAPGVTHAEPGGIYREMFVDRAIECGAIIMALDEDSQLASTVAGHFLNDAVNTMATLGGWDRDAATMSVLSRAVFMAEDIAIGLAGISLTEQLVKQDECVLGALEN